MPFLLFVAPRVADSTLHPNCAFLQGSKCDGITLQLNGTKIGLLGELSGREVVILQACHPRFFATHRYIVWAKLVRVVPRDGRPYVP